MIVIVIAMCLVRGFMYECLWLAVGCNEESVVWLTVCSNIPRTIEPVSG